jgi:predicted kinase
MHGVFQSKKNREEMRELFKTKGIELELFKAQYSDDESEDDSE